MALPKHLRAPHVRVLMKRLRKYVPLPVSVRLVQQNGDVYLGSGKDRQKVLGKAGCRMQNGKLVSFRITVDSRIPNGEKWEVIVHEWAHCLDRATRPVSRDCHDTRWGQHYSRAFKASVNWD